VPESGNLASGNILTQMETDMRTFATLTAATLTAATLLWGTASFARGYDDVITQAFTAAGYTNVQVSRSGGDWLVQADANGQRLQFVVDPSTGRSTRHSDDGLGHDANDDHGVDGAGHDMGDDHGVDGAGHDVGDDHGVDGAGHDVGDDHGNDGAGHDVGHDSGEHEGGEHGGENEGHGGNHD